MTEDQLLGIEPFDAPRVTSNIERERLDPRANAASQRPTIRRATAEEAREADEAHRAAVKAQRGKPDTPPGQVS